MDDVDAIGAPLDKGSGLPGKALLGKARPGNGFGAGNFGIVSLGTGRGAAVDGASTTGLGVGFGATLLMTAGGFAASGNSFFSIIFSGSVILIGFFLAFAGCCFSGLSASSESLTGG